MIYQDEAKQLADCLLKGDIHSSWKIVKELDQIGMNSCYVYDQVIRKALYFIGELWRDNKITVADEHLATGVAEIIVTRYSLEQTLVPTDHNALFFCIEGEEHVLGLKMVSAYFQEKGWTTHFLGANLPLEYAVYSVKKWKPKVVGISISMVHNLPRLQSYISALEELDPELKVFVGGRLVELYDLRPYCSANTLLISNIQQIQTWLAEEAILV